MGSHTDCSDWEYDSHPERAKLKTRCERLASLITKWPHRFDRYGFDTRQGHAFMFKGLAPTACTCIAGGYRGSLDCPTLTSYNVHIGSDPRVGVDCRLVAWQIKSFEAECNAACIAFMSARKSGKLQSHETLLLFVQVLCDALERFFWIHPYANGNGHSGRLLVWTLLARYGMPPVKWAIDSKVPYNDALKAYRDGNKKPLVRLMLQAIRP